MCELGFRNKYGLFTGGGLENTAILFYEWMNIIACLSEARSGVLNMEI